MQPLLSVITVCFNAESTLCDCIQSIAQGKTPEVEYLIIDGASTDGTLDIIRQYPHVVDGLISETDGGIFDAMNKGLSRAGGDFVAFLNADDVYLPGAILAILDAIRREGNAVDVLYGDWIGVDAGGEAHARRADHRLRWRYSLCHQALVARRVIFPTPRGFDLRYRLCADFDLILRWQSEGVGFKRLAQPLVRFSETGSSAKFVRTSAWESIHIALRRAQSPWALVFSARIILYFARMTMLAWFRRIMRLPFIPRRFCHVASHSNFRSAMNYHLPESIDDRPTVSVVIPVYNSGPSALLAIESVLSQAYQCAEIIVVDDGSSDNSVDLIRDHFLNQSKRIQIDSIENRGAAGARNFGISKATSDWVAFLDSDDIWFPAKLETQVAELERDSTISLIGALTNMRGFHIARLSPLERLTVISLRTLLFKNYFQTSTVVIRRAVIEELGGFPEGRRYAEEGDLFMRIAARYKCALLNEVMVDYAGGKRGFGASGISGLSANLWGMERGELRNIYGAWARRDSGLFLTGVALVFSLIKFARRVAIRLGRQLFRGA